MKVSVGSSLMGSTYAYELNPGGEEKQQKVDLIKSKKTEEIDVALDPSELELPESEIQKKFQQILVSITTSVLFFSLFLGFTFSDELCNSGLILMTTFFLSVFVGRKRES
jgi:hypothetical protein